MVGVRIDVLPLEMCLVAQAVWNWLPEPSAAELEAMAVAAAAQSRGRFAPICARLIAAVIPGATYTQPEEAFGGKTEFSPSRRHRVGNRDTRRNSPWDSDREWADETVSEEEQPGASLCCGIVRAKDTESVAAVTIQVPRSGRMIVYSAAFMAGFDAALLWASLPLAVVAIADVSLTYVGVIVGIVSAAHSLGQLLGAALLWHGRFRPLSRLKPLSVLLLGQVGLVVTFAALAISRQLLWIGCARLVCLSLFSDLTHQIVPALADVSGGSAAARWIDALPLKWCSHTDGQTSQARLPRAPADGLSCSPACRGDGCH